MTKQASSVLLAVCVVLTLSAVAILPEAKRRRAAAAILPSDARVVTVGERCFAFTVSDAGDLLAFRSADGGRWWRACGAPSVAAHPQRVQAVADAVGAVHLVWVEDRGPEPRLCCTTSPDYGCSWLAPIVVDESIDARAPIDVTIGRHGALRVAYGDVAPLARVGKVLSFGQTAAIRGSFVEVCRDPVLGDVAAVTARVE